MTLKTFRTDGIYFWKTKLKFRNEGETKLEIAFACRRPATPSSFDVFYLGKNAALTDRKMKHAFCSNEIVSTVGRSVGRSLSSERESNWRPAVAIR